jgi:hypothetical protein
MIVSVHIGKTGGATFLEILKRSCGSTLLTDYSDLPSSPMHKWVALSRRLRPRNFPVPAGTTIIHGHFTAKKYLRQFPEARLAVWLRDPVERTLSHYSYWKRNPDATNPACRRAMKDGFNLERFIALDSLRNLQSRYVDGIPLSRFAFVGITEHYERSLALFARIFDIDTRFTVEARHINPEKASGRYAVDERVRRLIEHANASDMRLYHEALKRFQELCDESCIPATSSPPYASAAADSPAGAARQPT